MKNLYAETQINEVIDEVINDINVSINKLEDLRDNNVDDTKIKEKITNLSNSLSNVVKEYKNLHETEGTQVTDIEKKEDYPKFKVGKQLSQPMVEDEQPKQVTAYTIYDCFGELETFYNKEDAEKFIEKQKKINYKEEYNTDDDPNLRIETSKVKVHNSNNISKN